MDLNELVNNYEDDLQAALKEEDSAQRTLLILDAFREFKNSVMKLGGGEAEYEYEVEQAPKVDLGNLSALLIADMYAVNVVGWLHRSIRKPKRMV